MTTLDMSVGGVEAEPKDHHRSVGNPYPHHRPWWWVSGPGLAVGLVSAFLGLDRKGFWLDEAYTLGAVSQLGRTLRETSGTMALYYPMVTAWSRISDSVWWMRSLTVLTAAGALVAVGQLARRLVGDPRARLVVALTALSPAWLTYAREARSYGLVMLLSALVWLALDHALADAAASARRYWWAVHTVVVALLPLAHGLALLQVAPQVLVLLVAGAGRVAWLRLARGLTIGLALTGALLLLGAQEVGSHTPSLRVLQVGIVLNQLTSPYPILAVAILGLLVVGGADLVHRAREAGNPLDRARAVVPVTWALGPILLLASLSVVRPSFVTRYVVGVVPALALLLVVALDRVTTGRPARVRGGLAVALAAILIAGHVRLHLDDRIDPWRSAAVAVADRARDGDAVLLPEDSTRPPFEAAWRDLTDPPDLDVVGSGRSLGRVLRFEDDTLPEPDRWTVAADADRLWVVGNPSTGDRFTIDDLTEGRAATHREAGRWLVDPSGLTVALLVPR